MRRLNCPHLQDVRRALWALLLRHHDMSLEQAGTLLDMAGIRPVTAALRQAVGTGLPQDRAQRQAKSAEGEPGDDAEAHGWSVQDILRHFTRTGAGVVAFWSLTPRETSLEMEGLHWRQKQAIAAAWYGAKFERAKQLPRLQSILGRELARPQTMSEMKKAIAAWEGATSGRTS